MSGAEEPDTPPRGAGVNASRARKCRDCGVAVSFLGQIAFTKQSNSMLLSLFAAITDRDATNLEVFPIDVFRCPQCGRLEMYDLDHSLPAE